VAIVIWEARLVKLSLFNKHPMKPVSCQLQGPSGRTTSVGKKHALPRLFTLNVLHLYLWYGGTTFDDLVLAGGILVHFLNQEISQ
jgi:hypothetical protein